MNKLKALRIKEGLSQAELGRQARISQSMITRMEYDPDHKDFRKITPQMAKQLAPILHTSIYELTGSLDAAAYGIPQKEKARFARMLELWRSES